MPHTIGKRSAQDWVDDLSSTDDRREAALRDLRPVLLAGLRRSFPDASSAGSLIEDFAQEALLRISARVESFRGDSRFETWAVSIAVRVGISQLRHARWKDVSLDEMMDAGRLSPQGDSGDHASSLDAARLMRLVTDAIETRLTPKQREAIGAQLSGAPPDEAAARLGTNRNAFYKLLYDARVHLRSAILAGGWTEDHVRQIIG